MIELRPTIIPTIKQDQGWQRLKDDFTKYIFFGGGAGGGKSWLGVEWLITSCYLYPGTKWFIGRNELSRLMKSSYITFLKVCKHHGIPAQDWKHNGQHNYIEFKNGSRIDLLDLAYKPSDPMYERFGSTEYTSGWIEEAGEVPFGAFDVLKSRIGRHLNKKYGIIGKMYLTFNPSKNWLYRDIYKKNKEGKLPENYAFIQSLYMDNPHTAEDYGKNLEEITDVATKKRLMYGEWEYESGDNVLIKYDSILDLWTNQVPEVYDRYITADIARYGQDKTVIYVWKGFQIVEMYSYEKQSLMVTAEIIRDLSVKEHIPYSHIIIDEDGVGGGVIDFLVGVKGFVNNSSPLVNPENRNKENYQNLKTQCIYILARYINQHKIAIAVEDLKFKEFLIEELEQVKSKDSDKDGKLKLIPKDEIKELIGRSPDYSDAMMMRMYYELDPPQSGRVHTYRPSIKRQL